MDVRILVCSIMGTTFVLMTMFPDIWREHEDDTSVLCFLTQALLAAIMICFTCAYQVVYRQLLHIYLVVLRYGLLRYSVFVCSVALFSILSVASPCYVFEVILDNLNSRPLARNTTIYEQRLQDQDIPHLLLQKTAPCEGNSEKDRPETVEFSRYPMEDAEFECSNLIVWDSADPPDKDLLTFRWRRNGKYFSWSARYRQNISTEEMIGTGYELGLLPQNRNLKLYYIVATLQIRLLKSFDFGNYTCEGIVFHSLPLGILEKLRYHVKTSFTYGKEVNGAYSCFKVRHSDSNMTSYDYRMSMSQYVFHILNHSIKHEQTSRVKDVAKTNGNKKLKRELAVMRRFELIEFKARTLSISAPPAVLLQYIAAYIQIENDREEVSTQFYLNNKPLLHEQAHTWDCPKIILFGFFLQVRLGLFHRVLFPDELPPFVYHMYLALDSQKATVPVLVLCHGPQSFGHLRVEFFREYFNVKTKRYERIIAHHPNDFVIQPQESTLFEILRSNRVANLSEWRESDLPTEREVNSMLQTAKVLSKDVLSTELLFIVLFLLSASLIIFVAFIYTVKHVCYFCKWWILDRPALNRNIIIERQPICDDWINQFSRTVFHFYLSFTDSDMNTVQNDVLPFLEKLRYTVCFRERDVPPNMQEVDAIDKAVTNSRRFVVFLSPHYLDDGLRLNLESQLIVGASSKEKYPSSALLVVKLGHCDVPGWLTVFPLHDWTASNLNRDDHLSRLYQWVKPASQRDWRQECAEMVYPVLVIVAVLLGALALKTYIVWQVAVLLGQ